MSLCLALVCLLKQKGPTTGVPPDTHNHMYLGPGLLVLCEMIPRMCLLRSTPGLNFSIIFELTLTMHSTTSIGMVVLGTSLHARERLRSP